MKLSRTKSLKIQLLIGIARYIPFARAIFFAATLLLCPAVKLAHAQSCMSSSGNWTNASLSPAVTGSFRYAFDATPSSARIDAISALSFGPAQDFSSTAAVIRFNNGGTIDIRNGGNFTAANQFRYNASTAYHFILDVNIPAHTYTVSVVGGRSGQTTLASNVAFRSEQSAVSALNNAVVRAGQGALTVCNVVLTSSNNPPPNPSPGSLTASTTRLNFGSVYLSTTNNQNITLTNSGRSNVSISSVGVAGAGFNATGSAAGLTLTPGQTTTIAASFTPPSTGTYTGSVSVSSSATGGPLTVALSGTGIAAAAGGGDGDPGPTPAPSPGPTPAPPPGSHAITLSWNSASSPVSGYGVYVGTTSGGPYSRLNGSAVTSTSYIDTNVLSRQTYYYVVTSISPSNTESAYSPEAKAVVP
jgi:hypothetical protein